MESPGNYGTSEARDCGSRGDGSVDGASPGSHLGEIRRGADLVLLHATVSVAQR